MKKQNRKKIKRWKKKLRLKRGPNHVQNLKRKVESFRAVPTLHPNLGKALSAETTKSLLRRDIGLEIGTKKGRTHQEVQEENRRETGKGRDRTHPVQEAIQIKEFKENSFKIFNFFIFKREKMKAKSLYKY